MRTFVFGAGASVHAGYPLASELWRAMERWARAAFPEGHYFRIAVDTMNAEFDLTKSFELVLTDLDKRIEAFLKEEPRTRESISQKAILGQLRFAVTDMIRFYFASLRSQPAELYRIFASDVLAPGDAVITFNYDLTLDREVRRFGKWNIGKGYGFEIDGVTSGDSPCKLFKLHGSTNWRGEPFQGNLGGFSQLNLGEMSLSQRPVIATPEVEYLGYSNASDPRSHNARVSIECLIMPTAKKKFFTQTSFGREWEGFWDSLWSQAGEALEISNEVHLIGYSIPEYDTRARELFATRIRKGVPTRVCCHSDTARVVESLKLFGNTHVQSACSTTFEGWVSNMKLG
jgi:hypothetical protein